MLLPIVGQGTGSKGSDLQTYNDKLNDLVYSIKFGIENGLTLIDTAEIYGDGRSELLVGSAVKGVRESVLLATKFSPNNHRYKSIISAAYGSLKRLGTDYIDIYQIHWPNSSVPLDETMSAIFDLQDQGFVGEIGVCNFNRKQIEEAISIAAKEGKRIYSVQIKFNLIDQFAYKAISDICGINNIKIIAYSPFKSLLSKENHRAKILKDIAMQNGVSAMQIALRWITSHPNTTPIPESSNLDHIKEISKVGNVEIGEQDMTKLSDAFSNLTCLLQVNLMKSRNSNRRKIKNLEKSEIEKFSLDFCPSIVDLSTEISSGDFLQPILVAKNSEDSNIYDIVEGELRYWAFVYVNGSDSKIPVIIN
jgi:diketogulonate reductase-like aldo/keto reductase